MQSSVGAGAGPSLNPSSSPSGVASADGFGLLGLLSVIRMTDPDLSMLALGSDLTTLGLNLNSPEYVSIRGKLYIYGVLGIQKKKFSLFTDHVLSFCFLTFAFVVHFMRHLLRRGRKTIKLLE